ncbi:hypothetical protein LIER_25644 [Lithospermum erythrorhizon]|uniref:Uncharacterized protein n=1 Tax=Lithospermum erythrorhizon TaxID=34254 RepID=A0AAV3R5I2_LITER
MHEIWHEHYINGVLLGISFLLKSCSANVLFMWYLELAFLKSGLSFAFAFYLWVETGDMGRCFSGFLLVFIPIFC